MAFDHALKSLKSLISLGGLAALRHDLFYTLLHRNTSDLMDLGDSSDGCNWTICTSGLNSGSVVYSAGVGRDISFEHALADRFGMTILLIDPSPTGIETMLKPVHQRKEFEFLPVALAGYEGELCMSPPGNPDEGSWVSETSQSDRAIANASIVKVQCETIESLMRKFGHTAVDLLKIDIEGAEYGVLESIMASGAHIRQIAVEFHSGVLPGIPRSMTISILLKLYRHGYRIVHKGGSNHTIVLSDHL
jgi:FkbM family methyltransferase